MDYFYPGFYWTMFIIHLDYMCGLFQSDLVILDYIYASCTMKQVNYCAPQISRVPDQNGVSQAGYIVEIHHSGREPSIFVCKCNFSFFIMAGLYPPGYDWTQFIIHFDYICDLFEAVLVILDYIFACCTIKNKKLLCIQKVFLFANFLPFS